MDTNIVWHHATVTRERRNQQNNHKSMVLWFTGLSGSGKSTLAHAVEEQLHRIGCRTFVLDGDNVRHGLNGDLGFSSEDRKENLRRVGEMSKLFIESGTIILTAFISPFRKERRQVRSMMPHGDFIEIYVNCPIEVCEKRDVKGLYRRARTGEVKEFTGISSPYEIPQSADLTVNTDLQTLEESVENIIDLLKEKGVF
ncbi:MAG: adenylyl-sulfate kinase [Gammaproteobacteria bacterium]|jgi:adenylylsulfate kinase|nr:adenylyl-sulfate kinase [Gammaproteobacteria bacterium]MBT3489917.1 adenylyl-sulfate kinase [Gammaproteobacteria bacterium]MBT3718842.1 adenylyl-sulfate kinase [Gammaproteobacteria bacterium]MBT3845844.1 adenylyl-sulfate kinase [Gammaproteobacteria bacterium]MBT3892336.1 adenylyl-sulfate kinase [Gammaproteobacteria bacterium]